MRPAGFGCWPPGPRDAAAGRRAAHPPARPRLALPRDPAAEKWVRRQASGVLAGKATRVAGAIRRQATNEGLDPTKRAGADTAATYMTNGQSGPERRRASVRTCRCDEVALMPPARASASVPTARPAAPRCRRRDQRPTGARRPRRARVAGHPLDVMKSFLRLSTSARSSRRPRTKAPCAAPCAAKRSSGSDEGLVFGSCSVSDRPSQSRDEAGLVIRWHRAKPPPDLRVRAACTPAASMAHHVSQKLATRAGMSPGPDQDRALPATALRRSLPSAAGRPRRPSERAPPG
jgi:hypothetical protein